MIFEVIKAVHDTITIFWGVMLRVWYLGNSVSEKPTASFFRVRESKLKIVSVLTYSPRREDVWGSEV
jgi:hypothetical protein